MPAQGTLCTAFYQDDRYGFSESLVWSSTSDPSTAVLPFTTLVKLRLAMSGFPTQCIGCRLSLLNVFRDSVLIPAGVFATANPIEGTFAVTGQNPQPSNSDQPKTSLLVRMEADTIHRKSSYLAGLPDVIFGEDPTGPRGSIVPAWSTAFNSWASQVVSGGWQFVARSAATGALSAQIVTAVQNQVATGLFAVATAGGGPSYAVGQRIQLRNFKMVNLAYKSANGQWIVDSVATGPGGVGQWVYLQNSTQVGAAFVQKRGTVEGVDFQAYSIIRVLQVAQTSRKRGNRFLAAPGRRRTRVFLPL